MIRVMYIGGHMHRKLAMVESSGGYPCSRNIEHAVPDPPWENNLSRVENLLRENHILRKYNTEFYGCQKIIVDGRRKIQKVAFVYVLCGIDPKLLDDAYLKEPGIMDQLWEIAT